MAAHNKLLDERSRAVLRAAVEAYINSAEPVASRTIGRNALPMSSASIRSLMSRLEARGLLFQPHTSAGRVPTSSGYRYYVDELMRPVNLTSAQQGKVHIAVHGTSLRPLMRASADALASAMGLVGFAMAVSKDDDLHRHIELVRLRESQLLAIHATWSGAVFHKVVRLERDVSQQTMDRAQNYLNERFGGLSREAMRGLVDNECKRSDVIPGSLRDRAIQLADIALPKRFAPDLDIAIGGQHHLLSLPEFSSGAMAGPVLEALEPPDTWRTMLDAFRENYDDPDVPSLESSPETAVLIGPEVPIRELAACTFVAGRLSWGDGVDGSVGLVGPMRLAYASAIAVVGFLRHAIRRKIGMPLPFSSEP